MRLPFVWLSLLMGASVAGQYTGTASVSQGRAAKTVSPLYTCPGGRPTDLGQITAFDGTTWTMPADVRYSDTLMPFASNLHNSCIGALHNNVANALAVLDGRDIIEVDSDGDVITAFVFADNYFEMYVNGVPVGKDRVPFTQFNSSIVRFRVKQPFTIAMLLVDWEENLGLGSEANGGFAYHPGDGGMVAVFTDSAGRIIALTDKRWKAQTFYTSPVTDLSCPSEINNERRSDQCSTQNSQNGSAYYALHWAKPSLWYTKDFDDSDWPFAHEFTNEEIGVNNKASYTNFTDVFDNPAQNARFIWSSNVILDNEVVVRYNVGTPTSVKDRVGAPELQLIPNPGNDVLSITYNNTSGYGELLQTSIINYHGESILTEQHHPSLVDTERLPAGIYIVTLLFQHQTICQKWIKQ